MVGVFRTKMFFSFCLGGCVLIRHRLYDVMNLGCGFTRGEFWGSGSGVWDFGTTSGAFHLMSLPPILGGVEMNHIVMVMRSWTLWDVFLAHLFLPLDRGVFILGLWPSLDLLSLSRFRSLHFIFSYHRRTVFPVEPRDFRSSFWYQIGAFYGFAAI